MAFRHPAAVHLVGTPTGPARSGWQRRDRARASLNCRLRACDNEMALFRRHSIAPVAVSDTGTFTRQSAQTSRDLGSSRSQSPRPAAQGADPLGAGAIRRSGLRGTVRSVQHSLLKGKPCVCQYSESAGPGAAAWARWPWGCSRRRLRLGGDRSGDTGRPLRRRVGRGRRDSTPAAARTSVAPGTAPSPGCHADTGSRTAGFLTPQPTPRRRHSRGRARLRSRSRGPAPRSGRDRLRDQ